MKQQLLQKRQTLIAHLQQKIQALSQYRNALSQQQITKNAASSHTNISNHLKKAGSIGKKQVRQTPITIAKQKFVQNQVNQVRTHSKADIIRQHIETKKRSLELQELYKRKKQLESLGIHEDNSKKINSLFNNKESKKQIDKKLQKNKKEREIKERNDKIIQQQLQSVKQFLNQSKASNKSKKLIPEKHFSLVFSESPTKLDKVTKLITKSSLSLVQKDQLLWQVFQVLKQKSSINKVINKQSLRQFLLSNQEFCKQFYIAKNEIMRDLGVFETSQKEFLTYNEFYQFTKSVQLTNLAMKPSLNFKNNVVLKETAQHKSNKSSISHKDEKRKQMQTYLKKLYAYLDNKNERIIQRTKLQISLKRALLFDDKKCKVLKKNDIQQFGSKVQKSRLKVKDNDYYKTLDLKYIGLDETLHLIKQISNQLAQNSIINTENVSQRSITQLNQEREMVQATQIEQEGSVQLIKTQLKAQLQQQDFQRYGWQESEDQQQNFKQLRQVDKHYKQVRNKYGNQIAWNGIEHYRQDFSKFNDCIKQMNIQHENQSKKS